MVPAAAVWKITARMADWTSFRSSSRAEHLGQFFRCACTLSWLLLLSPSREKEPSWLEYSSHSSPAYDVMWFWRKGGPVSAVGPTPYRGQQVCAERGIGALSCGHGLVHRGKSVGHNIVNIGQVVQLRCGHGSGDGMMPLIECLKRGFVSGADPHHQFRVAVLHGDSAAVVRSVPPGIFPWRCFVHAVSRFGHGVVRG